MKARAGGNVKLYEWKHGSNRLRLGDGKCEGKVGFGRDGVCAKANASLDVAKFENRHLHGRVGVSADTGFDVGKGKVGAKFLGLGGGIGKDGIFIGTPLFSFGVKF